MATIVKGKSAQEFKSDPYVATLLNCMLWVFYGMPFVHPDSLLVLTINGCGFVIELAYITIFLIYSPVRKKRMVIKTKSVKYMPFTLSLAIFCNGIVWFIYALLKVDPYILVPNGLGSLFGLFQLGLYATYYKRTNWDEDDTRRSDVELSNT
ncbi:hypothetical protein QYF36_019675 [Acer negundo]|nr:hypothetical protein QYF36_019675 [Acer negundo]